VSSMKRFSSDADQLLREAGWYPGREMKGEVAEWAHVLEQEGRGFPLFDAAERALLEFGGLQIKQSGPGIDVARAPFVLDPLLALGEDDRFFGYSRQIGVRLYPLGEAWGGHSFLAIAEDGRVFLLMDEIEELAKSMDEALERLIQGRRGPSRES
jgi:SUKH-3 immunity protein of toxin-antitoxin system